MKEIGVVLNLLHCVLHLNIFHVVCIM